MAHIKISKGIDIPIAGKPTGEVQDLKLSGEASVKKPAFIALNLDPFEGVRFKLLAKQGDVVKIGQALVEDKSTPGRIWASPAAGVIKEVRRGLKRRLLDIVIEVSDNEDYEEYGSTNVDTASREELISKLKKGGLFAHIRSRPFELLANPDQQPRSIFIKAIESAPFVPSPKMQVKGREEDFQTGLDALSKLTNGPLHLVYRSGSDFIPFTEAKNVQKHTAEGPHPIGTASVHIQYLDPIRKVEDVVWTLNATDVIAIGHFLNTGRYDIERIVSIAGPGIIAERTGFFRVRAGYPISSLISGRIQAGFVRFISGEPLTGQKVEEDDFLRFQDTVFCAIPESVEREFLHFMRLGTDKFSFSKAYLSGHLSRNKRYDFTTSKHGEHRAFIVPSLYDQVMPLSIPTMQLVKAVMAEDYDLAEELGLLEVVSEDFALATFVCPSKMEMTQIIKQGLSAYSAEVLE